MTLSAIQSAKVVAGLNIWSKLFDDPDDFAARLPLAGFF
jgi:hypothetical protein